MHYITLLSLKPITINPFIHFINLGSAASIHALPDDTKLTASDVENIVGAGNFSQYELDKILNSSDDPSGFHITALQLKQFANAKASLPHIRFIEFVDFCKMEQFPRYPENKDMCVNLEDINMDEALIVFISHCWLRGWSGAEGWDGRPHPDNASHDKFKLCVQGITQIFKNLAPGMKKCYVWLDFGCMDQDGNPAGELKQLDEIVRCCDCIFTPIVGMAEVPDLVYNYYKDYKVTAWNAPQYGYTSRGWCRVEMFYAANIPLKCIQVDRKNMMAAGLKIQVLKGVRPHMIYGTLEDSKSLQPVMLPPLQNSYFSQLNPADGHVSVAADKVKVAELVTQLKPYMKSTEEGYKGDKKNGRMHGKGVYTYASGNVYNGDWVKDNMHGKGCLTFPDGDMYDGDWVNSDKHGRGVFTYASGDVYDGDWVKDAKHGKGIYTYVDGDMYDGDWVNSDMHGRGVFTYASGKVCDGDWVKDEFQG